jgi:hypothetical protein
LCHEFINLELILHKIKIIFHDDYFLLLKNKLNKVLTVISEGKLVNYGNYNEVKSEEKRYVLYSLIHEGPIQ